jgi:serine/threonine-protein kinase
MSDTTLESHPSPERLSAFSSGRASAIEAAEISAHLSVCATCCVLLDRLQVDDPLLTRLRQAARDRREPGEDTDRRHQAVRALRRCRPPCAGEWDDEHLAAERGSAAQVYTPPLLPTVAGYEVLAEVGRGGMGIVYKARHLALGRLVALKMILAGPFGSASGHARLRLEAELAARVQHPNIVAVHEVGSHAGGAFLSMEWVDGGTLAARVGQPWPVDLAADLVKALARAVHAAHSQGVIHRDLKPANVLLQQMPAGAAVAGAVTFPKGSLVVPKVTDFGLALLEGGEPLTSTGLVMGTPAYMAPEQAHGDRARVGPATDVHALGVILYELLTGRPPFHSDDPMTVLMAVAAADPRAPRRLRRQVPRDLDTVCMKCLEKEPGKRYPSAAALADDLARWLEDKPILAQRPGFMQVAARWARRHKAVVWAAAVVLLVVAVIGGGVGLREVQKRARAEGEAHAALTEALELRQQQKWPEALSAVRRAKGVLAGVWVDEALRQEVEELHRDVDMALRLQEARLLGTAVKHGHFDMDAVSAAYEEAFAWYGLRLESVDPQQAGQFIRSRSIGLQLAAALDDWASCREWGSKGRSQLLAIARVADPDPWRDRLRDALERQGPRAREELVASARAEDLPPATVVLLARSTEGTTVAERVVAVLRQAQERHPDDFWVNHELGWCLYKLRPPRLEEAIRYYTAAVALRPQSPGARLNLGRALQNNGKEDEAIACYHRAIALRPRYAQAHTGLGIALADKGKLDEAIASHHKAIALGPRLALTHHNLGNALLKKRKVGEAIACYKKAIALDPSLAQAHTSLGIALADKGEVDEAIACFHRAIAVGPSYALAHTNLGVALSHKGKVDEAIACFHRALALAPGNARAHLNLGTILCDVKRDYEGAIACFKRALEIDPRDAEPHNNLGVALSHKGKTDEAIACWRKALALAPSYARAHLNLGTILCNVKRDYEGAIACFKRALEIDPKDAKAHNNLGVALSHLGKADEAIDCYQRAVTLVPRYARAHWALGEALMQKGQFSEGQQALRRSLVLLPASDPHRGPVSELLQQCQHRLDADGNLTAFRAGRGAPGDAAVQVQMAALAQQPYKQLYLTAARLYRDAFARQPRLVAAHRYNAACAAALAGCGQGKDAAALDQMQRASWRQQALDWLRADLTAWARHLEAKTAQARAAAQQQLKHWQQDADFAGVRDPEALARLPEAERSAWQKLWTDVADTLATAQGTASPAKNPNPK